MISATSTGIMAAGNPAPIILENAKDNAGMRNRSGVISFHS
jgi:hypothetical protein